MEQKLCLIWILFVCMLIISNAQKKIIFTKVECPLKSNKLVNVECFIESKNALNVELTVADNDVAKVSGIFKLNIQVNGQSKVINVNKIRLDICKMLTTTIRPSLLSFIYYGIQQTENNLPKKCPFKANTSYYLHHMKFDANTLPLSMPEYNFTFVGKIYGSNSNLFDVKVVGLYCDIDQECKG